MDVADTVVVVLAPESGDAVQTLKAGLLEIADILVVNKADKDGADRLDASLRAMVHMDETREDDWTVPVLKTQASNDAGVPELEQVVREHREFQEAGGRLEERRRKRLGREFMDAVETRLLSELRERLARDPRVKASLERVERGDLDPYSAALDFSESGSNT
jgi:LAO/AO transport system kinase